MSKIFSIGTFNLRNLALPQNQIYPDLSFTTEQYKTKISWSKRQLQRMNADIVAFQEVFDKEALKELCQEQYQDGFLIAPLTGNLQPRVGIVSRFPIESSQVFEAFPSNCQNEEFRSFRRPPLLVKIRLPDHTLLQVLNLHLKSKRPLYAEGEDPSNPLDFAKACARSLRCRASEAISIRQIFIKNCAHPTIVLGDFNDTPTAVTTQIIAGPKPSHWFTLSQKIDCLNQHLHCVSREQQRKSLQNVTYSHIHQGYFENIDHILLSNHFHQKNPRNIAKIRYLQYFNDHLIDHNQGWLKAPFGSSDHGQLVATISLKDGSRKTG